MRAQCARRKELLFPGVACFFLAVCFSVACHWASQKLGNRHSGVSGHLNPRYVVQGNDELGRAAPTRPALPDCCCTAPLAASLYPASASCVPDDWLFPRTRAARCCLLVTACPDAVAPDRGLPVPACAGNLSRGGARGLC